MGSPLFTQAINNFENSKQTQSKLKGSGLNGTYLSFFGCPFSLISFWAAAMICMSSGNGLGLRLTARGSARPGRFPTFRCAMVLFNTCKFVINMH